ncbi:MAG: heptosyltransferase [Candidatus Binatota bacterium]|nr:heptosyltransferase [Candidatus Binatota bacterium]
MPTGVERVLIVRLSSLGDVVHGLPVAVALRRRFPRVRITWAVEDWAAALVEGHPAVDRVIRFPPMRRARLPRDLRSWVAAFRGAARELREEPYDVSLDLQGLFKSALIAALCRAPLRLGIAGQREGAGLVSVAPPEPDPGRHVVRQNLALAELLGAPADPIRFDVPIDAAAARSISSRLDAAGLARSPFAVLHPSSANRWKTWPPERWSRVAAALADDLPVIVIGGKESRALQGAIARAAGPRVLDWTGETTLAEVVALLDRSTVHVAPDTGTLHVAAALGRPVAGLYGPTRARRLGPFGQEESVVEHGERCVTGCPRRCRRRRCLEAASPEQLTGVARQALARGGSRTRERAP